MQDVNEYVEGCPLELVFNLDEVAISDWEDRKAGKVVVSDRRPRAARRYLIHHVTSRKVKHISVIACVFAAGELLTRCIFALEDSASVHEQLNKHSV
jgi:hypothetical protein